jgi:hypothetical protein
MNQSGTMSRTSFNWTLSVSDRTGNPSGGPGAMPGVQQDYPKGRPCPQGASLGNGLNEIIVGGAQRGTPSGRRGHSDCRSLPIAGASGGFIQGDFGQPKQASKNYKGSVHGDKSGGLQSPVGDCGGSKLDVEEAASRGGQWRQGLLEPTGLGGWNNLELERVASCGGTVVNCPAAGQYSVRDQWDPKGYVISAATVSQQLSRGNSKRSFIATRPRPVVGSVTGCSGTSPGGDHFKVQRLTAIRLGEQQELDDQFESTSQVCAVSTVRNGGIGEGRLSTESVSPPVSPPLSRDSSGLAPLSPETAG